MRYFEEFVEDRLYCTCISNTIAQTFVSLVDIHREGNNADLITTSEAKASLSLVQKKNKLRINV